MPSMNYGELRNFDSHINQIHRRRHSVPADGNCFYSAVAHQLSLLDENISDDDVRKKTLAYLRRNRVISGVNWIKAIETGENQEQYLQRHARDGEWCDSVMIQATSSAIRYAIYIVSTERVVKVEPSEQSYGDLWLGRPTESYFVSLLREKKNGPAKTNVDEVFDLAKVNRKPGILKQPDNGGLPLHSPTTPAYTNPMFENTYEPVGKMNGPGLNPREDYMDELLQNEEEFIEEEIPPYDTFACEPPEDESRTTTPVLKFFTKTFKLLSYVIFASCAFGGALISKACVMVLVNSAKPFNKTATATTETESELLEHDIIRVWSYVIILCMMLAPEVLTMFYSMYRIIMKHENPLDWEALLWGGLWELLSAIGEGILFLKALPYLDATFALLLFPIIGFIPICVHIHAKVTSITDNRNGQQRTMKYKRYRNLALAILALIFQIGGVVACFGNFFPLGEMLNFLENKTTYAWTAAGILLASCRYWENFVTGSFRFSKFLQIRAHKLQQKIDHSRFRYSFIVSLMKSAVLIGIMFLVILVLEQDTFVSAYAKCPTDSCTSRTSRIMSLFNAHGPRPKTKTKIINSLLYVFATQACCSFAAFFFGRVACLTVVQLEAYTLPNVLVTPVIAALSASLAFFKAKYGSGLLAFVGLSKQYSYLTYYVDWNIFIKPPTDLDGNMTVSDAAAHGMMIGVVVVGLVLGWLGMVFITLFIWKQPENRLERMEVLFVKALYSGPLIDQALMLNRRQFEKAYNKHKKKFDEEAEKQRSLVRRSSSRGSRRRSRRLTLSKNHKFTPQLFLCATMWHETEQEMTQILTSMMRLDRDQGSRRGNAAADPDYYNFQIHVLFDDAMEKSTSGEIKTNKFVHLLCKLIPLAANKVELGKGYDLPPPVIYPTPYGGRLEFILPHGNLMVVHLKDKEKIRHRKRWSQCMYMYYILGYLQATKKAYKLDDVFLLALDGDVDFQPNALLLLLDRMKRNPEVGAACGRIHPTGTGPVVWFQKFEYAVGHWLQKTAEHVLGCVLCSPGCFSLFRGSALVEVNVMNMYTTKASEALHYVQWDQGEDRWLCTLLLKQGWRIEYSAASDSFTFAPEEFKEFYNQRRRWGPSTMANIFDILLDASLTVKNNTYISWGYISYQIGLMVSSILGPATVIMIVQGAYQYVFSWTAAVSLLVSLIPVVIFIILCYTTSADTQVAVAGILTILYALVMMAVIVGVIGAMATNVIIDPNSLFMILLVGLYAFTGLAHPQEVLCLMHGILYYLCVPSAFIFLMVYSLTNMNNVSWGTREVKKPVEEEAPADTLNQVVNKQTGKSLQVGPGGSSIYDAPSSSDGYYSCGLGNLCQCALCITPQPVQYHAVPVSEPRTTQPSSRSSQMRRRTTFGASALKRYTEAKGQQITGLDQEAFQRRLSKRMSVQQLRRLSERVTDGEMTTARARKISTQQRRMSRRSTHTGPSELANELSRELIENEQEEEFSDYSDDDDDFVNEDRIQEEGEEMLYWVIEGSLEDGVIEYLDDEEREFWKYIIKKYLHPLDENKAEKARIKSDLKDLRNKMTGAYFLANALWLVLNFALQLTITDIAITFYIGPAKISVNPVSFMFLLFFLIILIIQFSCMLVHRWSTALHLLSVTSLKWTDSRDGIKNTSTAAILKADRRNQKKELFRKTKTGNGSIRNPEDPITDEAVVEENNFSMRDPNEITGNDNEGYVNGGFNHLDSDSSSDDSDDPYETIQRAQDRFRSPMNNMSSMRVTEMQLDEPPSRRKSQAINMENFDSSSDAGLIPKASPPARKVGATDDIFEKRSALVHDIAKHVTTVRFAPDDHDEGNTQL